MASSSIHKYLFPQHPCFSGNLQLHKNSQVSSIHLASRVIRACSAVSAEPDMNAKQGEILEAELFACPICYKPLMRKGTSGFNLKAINRSCFECETCRKSYSNNDVFLDLTVTAGMKKYKEVKPAGTEGFRNPLVSFVYERGFRQNLTLIGYPDIDEEFKMAQEFFERVKGGKMIDVSCGCGLFTRKFAKSDTYSHVVALDYSENMLRQCYEFIEQDETVPTNNLALIRADVSRLPFESGSVDAVYAGVAIHCWPSPSNGVAEICRILQSGGVFAGSTSLRYSKSTPWYLRPMIETIVRFFSWRSLVWFEGVMATLHDNNRDSLSRI
ncbi:uncharacterized methyltransferase At2g41040, chloroplastic-like isoform X2 [Tripterygium wilfordii]|uniref:uncharacterized methyltransferase At2g41040, chloroplastic-like isoform X2 n=1 Tax=Tripterygium wilfordii TaxID=458696 RepID=UPI0018F81173|nr:uncharacterized methyltransferase At2g41040, chloroplastic-like isoform X2 [Tripterygium wilfordii]